MLKAIYNISQIYKQKNNIKDTIDLLVENPNVDKELSFIFETDKDLSFFKFCDVDIQDQIEDFKRYLYKERKGNAPPFSLSFKYLQFDKTIKRLKKYVNSIKGEEKEIIKRLESEVEKNLNIIKQKTEEIIKTIDKKEKILLTFKFKINEDIYYLLDFDFFKNLFIQKYNKDILNIDNKKDNKEMSCLICKHKTPIIMSSYKLPARMTFFTTDKPQFISGYSKNLQYKNIHICKDCLLDLDYGWSQITKFFNFKFAGLNYYLIPNLLIDDDLTYLKHFDEKIQRFKQNLEENQKIKSKNIEKLVSDEEDIEDLLSQESNALVYTMLFYEKNQSSFKILKQIKNILPSRFYELKTAREKTNKKQYFKQYIKDKKQETYKDILFSFRNIRNLTQIKDSAKGASFKIFLDIVENIFLGYKIDTFFLFDLIHKKIKKDFSKGYNYKITALNSLSILIFLYYLGLLNIKKGLNMQDKDQKLQDLFKDMPLIDTPLKKALVLLGVLVGKVLNIQYQEKGSKPFLKQLKSFTLSFKDMQILLPKTINKLEQYDKNYFKKLEEDISFYFSQVDEKQALQEKLSVLNFYLALGISLNRYIYEKVYVKEKDIAEQL